MVRIENYTNFSYQEIGYLIDNIKFSSEKGTHYVGDKNFLNIKFRRKKLNITIRYLKKYAVWTFRYDE